ncbi:MAG: plastocyanin/azurin family copper-binding protein [Alphaproteobacteria bacterium]
MMFVPKYLEIRPGDRVTWVNEADEEHNVITFPDGYPRGAEAFQSPIMTRAGDRFSHQFKIAGTYEYHCIPHLPMGMHGLVIVERVSNHDEFHQPSPAEVKAYRNLMLEWFDEGEFELPGHEERASAD